MNYIKPFEELEFYDDFMFGLVMQDKELCRKVLECLLGIKIKEINFPEPQKAFERSGLLKAEEERYNILVQIRSIQ